MHDFVLKCGDCQLEFMRRALLCRDTLVSSMPTIELSGEVAKWFHALLMGTAQ